MNESWVSKWEFKKQLLGNGFVIELDADEMRLGLGRLEIHPELGVALRLKK